MADKPVSTIWVCVCCLFAREGDGCGPDCDCAKPDAPQPWGEVKPPYSVTMGMFREEHECPEGTEECDCERKPFDWRPCEGCGSPLGGERQAYTLWITV